MKSADIVADTITDNDPVQTRKHGAERGYTLLREVLAFLYAPGTQRQSVRKIQMGHHYGQDATITPTKNSRSFCL